MEQKYIKPPVEIRYADELEALKASDTGRKPDNWYLSPKAVRTFILGSDKVFEHNGNKIRIMDGMECKAKIVVGTKNVMGYLMENMMK